MSLITTHVLDLSTGKPATGVTIVLAVQAAPGQWDDLARGVTDADGRLRDLLGAAASLKGGTYRLTFATADYFRGQGATSFYPSIAIEFVVTDPIGHYHVPLLLSPFCYSTYRGS